MCLTHKPSLTVWEMRILSSGREKPALISVVSSCGCIQKSARIWSEAPSRAEGEGTKQFHWLSVYFSTEMSVHNPLL